MGVPDRICNECRRAHDGCPANSVQTCIQFKRTCKTCAYKAPGRFSGMSGSPGISEQVFYGCALLSPAVGVQDRTRACGGGKRASCFSR